MIRWLLLALAALAASAAPAGAQPEQVRIAVIAGGNLGGAGDDPLRFAESDARRMREILVGLGGVAPGRLALVTGANGSRLRTALAEARARAAEARAAGKRVVFLFYFSGHGDHDALHLAADRFALTELRAEIARVPADVRLMIVDACRTAAMKGVRKTKAFPVVLAPGGPRGSVELWSAAPGEVAQESGEIEASVFSHYLAAGLRGDADLDRDHQVTLGEIYSYVQRRTVARTAAGAAIQHPELSTTLSGVGELIVSTPGRASAFLGYAGTGQVLVIRLPSQTTVGELSGGQARLALPPGKFLAVLRDGGARAVSEVDLTWGGVRVLKRSDFRPVSREDLVARGPGLLRSRRVEAHLGAQALRGDVDERLLGGGAGLARVRGGLVLGVGVALFGGSVAGASEGRTFGGGIHGRAGWRPWIGRATLEAFAALDLRATRQEVLRDTTSGATQDILQLGGGPQLGARVYVDTGGHAAVFLEAAGGLLVQRQLERPGMGWILELAAGLHLGATYAF